jgi:hypothetical protein
MKSNPKPGELAFELWGIHLYTPVGYPYLVYRAIDFRLKVWKDLMTSCSATALFSACTGSVLFIFCAPGRR